MFQFTDNSDPAAFLFPPYGQHIIENNYSCDILVKVFLSPDQPVLCTAAAA